MPSRVIREGILESERVDRLSIGAEVFYRRAMSKVDDAGRYYAKPELLLAALFPLRIGRVKTSEISVWLRECVQAKLIRVYVVEEKAFLEIIDFRQQVRSRSKFPDPPTITETEAPAAELPGTCNADAMQVPSKCAADVHLFGFEDEVEHGAQRTLRARAGQETSPDFEEFWAHYPKREGGNPKKAAWRAWKARLAAGAKPVEIIAGARRYADSIRANGREGSPYVKQAATFLGPEEHFRESWATGRDGDHGGGPRIDDGAMV